MALWPATTMQRRRTGLRSGRGVAGLLRFRAFSSNIVRFGKRITCGSRRIENVRVFYDIRESTVEILAIVAKSEAEKWLAESAKLEAENG
jgi:hypothetical protein